MLFDRHIEPGCAYCEHGVRVSETEIACVRRGVVDAGGACKDFRYDPLKREPPEAGRAAFDRPPEEREALALEKRARDPLRLCLRALLLGLGLGLMLILALAAVLDGDSLRNLWGSGFRGFFNGLSEHFQLVDGHVLTYAFEGLVQRLGRGAQVLCYAAVTLAVPLPILLAERKRARLSVLTGLTLFVSLLFLLQRNFMAGAYLWFPAFCGYVLPAAMLVLLLRLLQRTAEERMPVWFLCLVPVWALLCGAQTEQAGITAVFACALWFARALVKNRRLPILLPLGLSGAAAGAGLCTVLLSPAGWTRLPGGLSAGLARVSALLIGSLGSAFALGLFLAASGLFLMRALRKKWGWALIVAGLVPPLWCLTGIPVCTPALILTLLAVGAVGVVLFGFTEERFLGTATLAGLLLLILALWDGDAAVRTVMPGLLLLIAATAGMGSRLLFGRGFGELAVCAALLAAAACVQGPALSKYRDGSLEELYHPAVTSSDVLYTVMVDGKALELPAFEQDGQMLFHARVPEALGGDVQWGPEETRISLGERSFSLRERNSVAAVPDGKGGETLYALEKQHRYPGLIYLPAWLLRNALGLQFHYSSFRLTVTVTVTDAALPAE